MPTVPTYGQPRVGQAPLPGLRTDPVAPIEAFGGGQAAAQAFGQAQGLARDVAQQQFKLLEEKRKEAHDLRMSEARRAMWDAEKSISQDLFSREGKNAAGIQEESAQRLEKFREDYEKKLATTEDRAAFREMYDARSERAATKALIHETQQLEQYEDNEYEAGNESFKDEASTDPTIAMFNSALLVDRIVTRSKKKGWGEQREKQELMKHETDLHVRVVASMLHNGQDLDASEYWKSVDKKRLDPDVVSKINKTLKDGSRVSEARRIASELSESANQEEALEKLEKKNIKDTAVYDQAKGRIRETFALQKQAKAERQQEAFNEAWSLIDQTGGNLDDFLSMKAAFLVNKSEITPTQWGHLENRAEELRMGRKPVTDQDTFDELMLMSAQDPQQFLAVDLRTRKLSNGDRERFSLIKAQIIKDGRSAEADGYLTEKEIVDSTLRRYELNPRPKKNSVEAETVDRFKAIIDRAISAEKGTGKRISNDKVREIVKAVTDQVTYDYTGFGFFSRNRRLIDLEKLKAVERVAFTISQVSETERRAIVDRYRQVHGGVPTDTEILNIYNASPR